MQSRGPISQGNQIHRKINCKSYKSDLYCDITLYLAIMIDFAVKDTEHLW